MTNVSGINPPFEGLSQSSGQVIYALLTRAPLYSLPEGNFLVRLACVKHAASVRSEPGSNSPVIYPDQSLKLKHKNLRTGLQQIKCYHNQVAIDFVSVRLNAVQFSKIKSSLYFQNVFRISCCGDRHSNSFCLMSQAKN